MHACIVSVYIPWYQALKKKKEEERAWVRGYSVHRITVDNPSVGKTLLMSFIPVKFIWLRISPNDDAMMMDA